MHDIVIVGAGPVGASLAAALAPGGRDVVVLDARRRGESARSDRSLALSHGSRLVFERLGIWAALDAVEGAVTPIVAIDISQRGGFGAARITAAEARVPALGYVVSYHALQHALDACLARGQVRIEHDARAQRIDAHDSHVEVHVETGALQHVLAARLVVVADGSGELVPHLRRWRHDYRQVAVVGKLHTREPHRGVAYERFTPEGPMALLPGPGHYGLVWTATAASGARLLDLPEAQFLQTLRQRFGPRVEDFVHVEDRRMFPLALEFAHRVADARAVVLGNAAQALHPVAGQGFNLGVRDAYELAQELLRGGSATIGTPSQLARYARARRVDRVAGIAFTHSLLALFGNDRTLLRWPRGVALSLLDAAPPVKRIFTRAMLFGMTER